MPIYAYRCASCGHAKDVLQKVADPLLTVCPACGADAFRKQVTAAGFQLKGSGWYVTDFRGGGGAAAPAVVEGKGAKPEDKDKPATAPAADAAASPAPSPAAAPAPPAGSTPAAS